MARECQEHICKSLQMMGSLVSTAVNDLARLVAEMKKFMHRTPFPQLWDKQKEETNLPRFMLAYLGIGGEDKAVISIKTAISDIKAENDDPRLKKRLIDALNCSGLYLKRVLRECNESYSAALTDVCNTTRDMQRSFTKYLNNHNNCALVSHRANPDSSISQMMLNCLTQKGLLQASGFQETSEDLHARVKEMFKKVTEDAARQYNQAFQDLLNKNDIWKIVEKIVIQTEDFVTQLTGVDPKESVKLHFQKKKILALLEEADKMLELACLLLIEESPKVIKGSFELCEKLMEELFVALRKTKEQCEKLGMFVSDKITQQICMRFPKETLEMLQEPGKPRSETRRKFNPPFSPEGGIIKNEASKITELWFQYMSDYVPFVTKNVYSELPAKYSEGLLNLLPCGGRSQSLLQKIKEYKVRISGGIKLAGTLYQIPDALIFECKRLASDQQSTLLFPRVAILDIEAAGEDSPKECLMVLQTVKDRLPIYLQGSDRTAIVSWFKQTSKDQEDKFPILRVKPCEAHGHSSNEEFLAWKDSVWLSVPSSSSVAGSVHIDPKFVPRLRSRANRAIRSAYWLADMTGRMLESKALFPGFQLSTFLPLLVGNPRLKNHLGAIFEATFMKLRKGKDQIEVLPLHPATNFIQDTVKPNQVLVERFLSLPAGSTIGRLYQTQAGRAQKVCGVVITVIDCMMDTVLIVVNSETGAESQLWAVRQLQLGVEVLRSTTALSNKANQEGDFDTCWKNLVHKKLEDLTQSQMANRKEVSNSDSQAAIYKEASSQLNVSKSVAKESGNSTTMMQYDDGKSSNRYEADDTESRDGWTEDLSALSFDGGEEEHAMLTGEVWKQ